ncbi:MAG TPA: DinB family protein [Fimbriimonadaceae bacterium]|nr:DinB family protein [Fimbriimonadaceae bacterium]
MDVAEQLKDTWRINCRLNHALLDGLNEEQLAAPLAKGKAVVGQFAHIHNVRRMWLRAVDPAVGDSLEKLERGTHTREELKKALEASDAAMANVISNGLASGRVKNFKPHPVAFVGYMIAHEGNHRAQIELAVRQAGIPLTPQQEFGLWEWGKF